MRKYTIALALAFVTAAVTFSTDTIVRANTVHAQLAGEYQVVITNLGTGKKAFYRPTWPDQNRCDTALANIPVMLTALRNPDPAVKVPDYNGPDKSLNQGVFGLAMQIFQSTGIVPSLSASCELKGDPA